MAARRIGTHRSADELPTRPADRAALFDARNRARFPSHLRRSIDPANGGGIELPARKLIIAIDGPVGSGKSTVARRVAESLGYSYLDSGAMYRALALAALRAGILFDDPAALERLTESTRIDFERHSDGQRVRLHGEDVTDAIRAQEISLAASKVAALAGVRHVLVAEQRRAGAGGAVVMEGRDIGTVVFPSAELKIFLDASLEVRARRRWLQQQEKNEPAIFERTLVETRERDQRDRERVTSPLVRAADAVLVDNTAMDADETARLIVLLARELENEERPAPGRPVSA
jgi:cytidylate kinase